MKANSTTNKHRSTDENVCVAEAGAWHSAAGTEWQAIAPGVWRIRIGEPEAATPTAFRQEPLDLELLRALPLVSEPPLAAGALRVRISPRGCLVSLPMGRQDGIYGCGLQLQSFDQHGLKKLLRVNSDPVKDTGDSHAPVPWFASTAGYGLFLDTSRYVTMHFGSHVDRDDIDESDGPSNPLVPETTLELYVAGKMRNPRIHLEVPCVRGVDLYLFGGPDLPGAIRRWVLWQGGGALPALHGLGAWYRGSGRFTQDEALALARRLRERGIPGDVFGLEPGWQDHSYSCSHTWSRVLFPQPDRFLAGMAGLDWKVNCWGHCFTHPISPLYPALKPLSADVAVWNGLVPDFQLPAVSRIYADHAAGLLKQGVSGFKVDECDHSDFINFPWSFPEHAVFPSGVDGEQAHTLLGVQLMRTFDEAHRAVGRRPYGQIRSAGPFASPHAYVLYSDLYDHRQFLRGVATAPMSGLLWAPEVRDCESVEDLVRRVQSAALSVQCLINAWYLHLPPWEQIETKANARGERMPGWEAAEAMVREALRLRMSLVPYLYSAFARYRSQGIPPVRPLIFDFPGDERLRRLDDAWLFGEGLLVAPLRAGELERRLPLPEGDWFDYWTGRKIAGGTEITITAPLDRIPLFVRSGCLLPLAVPMDYISDSTVFEITVRCYGAVAASFELYEDDGESFAFENGHSGVVKLDWDGTAGRWTRLGASSRQLYRIAGWESIA